ncbi:MAG: hypothetical protein PVH61_44485 [Candidatus Aminicenantes bacterium]|jgi:hypothetical protein
MKQELTKTHIPSIEKRRPEIKAPSDLWKMWDNYLLRHGYQTDSEGFRAVMINVTGFRPENQEKIA